MPVATAIAEWHLDEGGAGKEGGRDMSGRGIDFLENWVNKNVTVVDRKCSQDRATELAPMHRKKCCGFSSISKLEGAFQESGDHSFLMLWTIPDIYSPANNFSPP